MTGISPTRFRFGTLVFGTLYRPAKGERRETGMSNIRVEDLWDVYTQLLKGSSRYCWASLLGSMLQPRRRP